MSTPDDVYGPATGGVNFALEQRPPKFSTPELIKILQSRGLQEGPNSLVDTGR
jgi:hypothetical protein